MLLSMKLAYFRARCISSGDELTMKTSECEQRNWRMPNVKDPLSTFGCGNPRHSLRNISPESSPWISNWRTRLAMMRRCQKTARVPRISQFEAMLTHIKKYRSIWLIILAEPHEIRCCLLAHPQKSSRHVTGRWWAKFTVTATHSTRRRLRFEGTSSTSH